MAKKQPTPTRTARPTTSKSDKKSTASKPAPGKTPTKPSAAPAKPAPKPGAKPSPKPPAAKPAKPASVAKPAPGVKPPAVSKPAAPVKPAVPSPKPGAGAKTSAAPGKPPVKPSPKPTPKPAAKPGEPKPSAKGAVAPKGTPPAPKPAGQASLSQAPVAGSAGSKPGGRKGITIVQPKPVRKDKPSKPPIVSPPAAGQLLAPGVRRKPLIPSGPNAPANPWDIKASESESRKTPFTKKELEQFREILLKKRAELVGDVSNMEREALMSHRGQAAVQPTDVAEQGSDAYDQSLSLGLAEVDRKLIREIDEALKRIDAGTYGVCELTAKPINPERLRELPWTRYSIDAARALERQTGRA